MLVLAISIVLSNNAGFGENDEVARVLAAGMPQAASGGYITNGMFIVTNVWSDTSLQLMVRMLSNGIPGNARYVAFDATNFVALFNSKQEPVMLLGLPNFTIPSSIKPYYLNRSNGNLIIGPVFKRYTNSIMHVITNK